MTTSFVTLAVTIMLSGAVFAQQPKKMSKAKPSSGKSGTMTLNQQMRSSPSAANTYDGTGGASTGTGLTNDQRQGASRSSSTSQPTKVSEPSSIHTMPSGVKARKKSPKDS